MQYCVVAALHAPVCFFKGTVRPDWISLSIIGKALKKTSTGIVFFDFFIFNLEFFKNFKILSRFIQKASNPPTCWITGCMDTNRDLFR